MNLSDFAKPIVAKNHFVKASFAGFAGSGKTRTASEFVAGCYKDMGCTKPVLFIDNEQGSRFLIPFFKSRGIEVLVKDTLHLADVLAAFDFLTRGDIDFLFIDSMSKVWYQFVRDYKAKNHSTFMQLQDWGKILPDWQEKFSDRFVQIPGNIVFTGRGGFSYEKEEDVKDESTGRVKKGAYVKSGVKMKMAGETAFEPDLNFWMEQEQEVTNEGITVHRTALVMKDRSGLIDGKTFINPTYSDLQPVVKYLIGVPTGEVAGESNSANLAASESYDGRKRAREIELEKIKGLFDIAGFGTSKEDKALKSAIIQKVFGTLSMTEIERFDPENLTNNRDQLSNLLTDWKSMRESGTQIEPLAWVETYALRATEDLKFDK